MRPSDKNGGVKQSNKGKMTEKTLKVQKIEDGTVIDHVEAGKGWDVITLLGLENFSETVMLLANVHSKTKGKKDVIKIEHKQVDKEDVNKIALVSPKASVNIIKGFEIKEKFNVKLPKEVVGILRCTNPVCVTLVEPVKSRFVVEEEDPLRLRCAYCERIQSGLVFKE
jgi:aspartate carbamoyltransferase regulatory subunit